MTDASQKNTVYIPVGLQALVVSEDFPNSDFRIAPLIQPDYSKLRSESPVIEHDVFEELDTTAAALRASVNTRFVDVTTGQVQKDRMGVYLSWCMPAGFRTGVSSTESAADHHNDSRAQTGINTTIPDQSVDSTTTEYTPVPDRWVILRYYTYIGREDIPGMPATMELLPNIDPNTGVATWLPRVFVVESNRVRNLNDPDLQQDPLPDVDNITAPFVDENIPLEYQYETRLGFQAPSEVYSAQQNIASYRKERLTVIENANPYFADFQPHNTGVFSFFDDLKFEDGFKVNKATITYHVFGIYSDPSEDPIGYTPNAPQQPTIETILSNLSLEIPQAPNGDLPSGFLPGLLSRSDLLSSTPSTGWAQTVLHGTLNDLQWDRFNSAVPSAPSIGLQAAVLSSHPVAVGDNAFDALMGWLRVANPGVSDINDVTTLLSALEPLILGDEDVTSQLKSQDSMASNGFSSIDGGVIWYLGSEGGPIKTRPSPTIHVADDAVQLLASLNNVQSNIDAAIRESKQLKEFLWYEWWKAKTDTDHQVTTSGQKLKVIQDLLSRLNVLGGLDDTQSSGVIGALKGQANSIIAKITTMGHNVQAGQAQPFSRATDPTVLFAGIHSGWPSFYEEKAVARIETQIFNYTPRGRFRSITAFPRDTLSKIFPDHSHAIETIVSEWASSGYPADPSPWKPPGNQIPDGGRLPNLGVDSLGEMQGWFPLFIEWELEYYHIPWENWTVAPAVDGTLSYCIRPDVELSETNAATDCRRLTGRAPVAPQVASSLRNKIQQLLVKLNPEELQNYFASPEEVQDLLKTAAGMQYFSVRLNGVMDHLLTLMQGTHLSPTRIVGGTKTTANSELQLADFGIGEDELLAMSDHSDVTPYGNRVSLSPHYKYFSPFKPVTHGQARFTKLNIIDKFGQIVTCIEPPQPNGTPASALYPCTAPSYSCQPSKSGAWPNTVVQADPKADGVCQFFQLPPRINQYARVNTPCLIQNPDGRYAIAPEWNNPIWGWCIVNFADYSLQLYESSGSFLGELFLRLDDGPSVLKKPTKAKPTPSRIVAVMQQLASSSTFAKDFFMMLTTALDNTTSTPADYPDFLPAAIGRPFAFVDFGVSLELACKSLTNQSNLYPAPPELGLSDYDFPYQLGDRDAAFDGLVGYFKPLPFVDPKTASPGQLPGIKQIFTRFKNNPLPTDLITSPQSTESFWPFFVNADSRHYEDPVTGIIVEDDDARTKILLNRLDVYSAIVDPFVPVHVYTGGLLPPRPVEIPHWAVEKAMREIKASYAVGPLLVPAPIIHTSLTDDNGVVTTDKTAPVEPPPPGIQVPAPPFGQWVFKQQILNGKKMNEDFKEQQEWQELAIQPQDMKLRMGAKDPPVVVEGWIQAA